MKEQIVSRPGFVIASVEKLTPTHPREDRQNQALGIADRDSRYFDRLPPNRQVMQQRKQIAVMHHHSGPRARNFEGHCTGVGADKDLLRESQQALRRSLRKRNRRWTQGDARRQPTSCTVEASREETETIKSKEQRRAMCFGAALGFALLQTIMNLCLAAAVPFEEFEHFEFSTGPDPCPARGGTKEDPIVSRLDLYVGCKRIGQHYRVRGHERTPNSIGARV
jgi:hypothetical protein